MVSRIVFILFIAILVFGCIQEEKIAESKISAAKFEEVNDCQCHTLAYKYPDHVNGTKYCLDCHKIEYHPPVSEKSLENCSECHESSLFRIHMPNHSCVVCHGDAKSIHEKFEKKFLEGQK